jgi:putative glycerol-1-phosphate prenyltransferase
MKSILQYIQNAKDSGEKLLAILLDPDKLSAETIVEIIDQIHYKKVDFLFVGGSVVKKGVTSRFVQNLKKSTRIPVVIFPGDFEQITDEADAILFLSLLSGRNPEYLIEQQIKSVPAIKKSHLEVISTGYILIDGGKETAVQRVSNTKPISQKNSALIVQTACAGMFAGKQIIYLEAGSGALHPVHPKIIKEVRENITIPIIVGGGIKTKEQLQNAFQNGADLVVIGNGFEENKQLLTNIL